MDNLVPAVAFPPGEFLREALEGKGWSQVEFAEIIGRPVKLVSEIVNGKTAITPTTAKEIGAALGTSAILWLNLEATYRLHRDREPVPARITRQARLRAEFPVRELVRRGWVPASKDAETLETSILRYYGVDAVEKRTPFAHAAKRTDYAGELSREQEAWLLRVKQVAETMPTAAYSERRLRERLADLRRLTSAPEEMRHVPKILAECGVRFVIVEPLSGSKIDGVCFWLRAKAPVIGMTLLHDRIDNFWFVLRHEIEHVLRQDGRTAAVLDVDTDAASGTLPPEEQAANAAAAEFCVPQAQFANWIARVRPLFSEERLLGFAAVTEVHPGIVAGQLRRRLARWDLFTKYLVKVRPIITRTAITDGYGHVGAVQA